MVKSPRRRDSLDLKTSEMRRMAATERRTSDNEWIAIGSERVDFGKIILLRRPRFECSGQITAMESHSIADETFLVRKPHPPVFDLDADWSNGRRWKEAGNGQGEGKHGGEEDGTAGMVDGVWDERHSGTKWDGNWWGVEFPAFHEDGDIHILKLPKNAKGLKDCEAADILQGIREQMICMIANISPESGDEVFVLAASLKDKKNKVKELLKVAFSDLAKLKQSALSSNSRKTRLDISLPELGRLVPHFLRYMHVVT
ncbi:hypothetical protein RHMOL_Rhmol02G0099200 [Rhododendron molle]|uniref:Uncharacterized protein n=1 Tax=Rhododendron molle TaxID=49168 RepID=A0ACC0PNV8_RHOML|nr:hypothetical protein RHMOL_Rhmol02G0099200 [Rhododendron molle]